MMRLRHWIAWLERLFRKVANFYISMSSGEIAAQIAGLLNHHNKLTKKHNRNSIQRGLANYFVEVDRDKVIGCVASMKASENLSTIKHMCVHPDYRQRGIAKKLAALAIEKSSTTYVNMTIRADNIPSQLMAKSLGFVFVERKNAGDHDIIMVGRKK